MRRGATPGRVVWDEGLAHLRCEGWRGVILVLVGAALVAATVALDLAQRRDAVAAEHQLTRAGMYVYVARPATEGTRLDAARCQALGANPAVIATGGFQSARDEPLVLAKAPGWRGTLRAVTGSMPQLLTGDPEARVNGVGVLSSQAPGLGLVAGSNVVLGPGRTAKVTVLDVSERLPDPGSWLLHTMPSQGDLSECWAEFRPSAAQEAPTLMNTWLRTGPGDVTVSPLLAPDKLRTSPLVLFENRSSRYGILAAGVVLGVLHAFVLWFRRAEMALYRTLGIARTTTAGIYSLTTGGLTWLGSIMGVLYGAVIGSAPGPPATPAEVIAALLDGVVICLLATLLFNAVALALASGPISDFIRDRL